MEGRLPDGDSRRKEALGEETSWEGEKEILLGEGRKANGQVRLENIQDEAY